MKQMKYNEASKRLIVPMTKGGSYFDPKIFMKEIDQYR